MSVESWANAVRQVKWRQKFEHQCAIDTIQELLNGDISPNTAAGAISSLYEPLIKKNFNPSPVATLWGVFCDAARNLGGSKELPERLLDLLDSISQLPDVTDMHGNAITPPMEKCGSILERPAGVCDLFREYAIGKSSIRGFTAKYKCPITGRQLTPLADIEDADEMESGWDDQAVSLLNATTSGAMY